MVVVHRLRRLLGLRRPRPRCCAPCGPLARRSALTAALVVRLVPVAAADARAHARGRCAARARRRAGRARGAGPPAGRGLARPRDRRRRDPGAARALARDARPAAPASAPLRRRPLLLAAGDRDRRARASPGCCAGAGGFDDLPAVGLEIDLATLALTAAPLAGAAAPALAARRPPAPGQPGRAREAPVPEPVLRCEGLSLPLPGGRRERARGRRPGGRAGRAGRALRALGLGQDDPAARGVRAGPSLPRRRGRGRARGRRPGRARRTARPSWRPRSAWSPRSPRPRSSAPRSGPRSSCRWSCAASRPPSGRARVEEVALALAIADLLERTTDTLSGGELQRVALAAALATPARRWCCSTSRPRSSIPSRATS